MKFIVKPNKKYTKIINFDENKQAYIIEVKGKPINNEVNLELIKFLSKKYKTTNIKIIKGMKSREKIINIK
ncbi:MAG TPA: DUF167 domain-containing protein [Candidatus Nanoarchaeia archaeon]|nr:DUF167 domain-containing protein [Candidatus Nanoarchaeia archaeon]